MKRITQITLSALAFSLMGYMTLAQDESSEKPDTIKKEVKKEVKVTIDDKEGEPKYTVETTTTKDGEKKVVKKTYKNMEEMKADESLDIMKATDEEGNISLSLKDKGAGVMVISTDKGETFNIKIDEFSDDLEWIQEGEGQKIIELPGKRLMFINEDDGEGTSEYAYSIQTEAGDSNQMVKRYEVRVIQDGEELDHGLNEHKNVIVYKDEEGNVSIHQSRADDKLTWVDEKGNKTIERTIHLKSEKASFATATIVNIGDGEDDFTAFNLAGMPELVLKSLNYYPNPNQGEFTLAFSGSRKPVIVRILDLGGNLKLERNIEDFDGNFNEVLNVKHFDKGTYLLQIFQQDKVLNRKLMLE